MTFIGLKPNQTDKSWKCNKDIMECIFHAVIFYYWTIHSSENYRNGVWREIPRLVLIATLRQDDCEIVERDNSP